MYSVFQIARGVEKCLNQVTLLGRVGQEPQLRGTDAHPVVTFSLATNYRYAQFHGTGIPQGVPSARELRLI